MMLLLILLRQVKLLQEHHLKWMGVKVGSMLLILEAIKALNQGQENKAQVETDASLDKPEKPVGQKTTKRTKEKDIKETEPPKKKQRPSLSTNRSPKTETVRKYPFRGAQEVPKRETHTAEVRRTLPKRSKQQPAALSSEESSDSEESSGSEEEMEKSRNSTKVSPARERSQRKVKRTGWMFKLYLNDFTRLIHSFFRINE